MNEVEVQKMKYEVDTLRKIIMQKNELIAELRMKINALEDIIEEHERWLRNAKETGCI